MPSAEAPQITLVIAAYNSQPMIDRQVELWCSYDEALRDRIAIIVVDDASDPPLGVRGDAPLDLTLARVLDPIHWNQPGGRNLAMRLARTDWALLTDVDHGLPEATLRSILDLPDLKRSSAELPRKAMIFDRRSTDEIPHDPHLNSFLLPRRLFWEIGGYDEDFCGQYGHDDDFFRVLLAANDVEIENTGLFLICDREAHTSGLERDSKPNARLLKKKRRLVEKGRYAPGPVLRFAWEVAEVLTR